MLCVKNSALFFSCLLYINSFSQESTNASGIGRAIENPSANYTGVHSELIPIHSLEQGQIQLPIQLVYQSSGIKVSQESSWIGLGWELNTGGMISRVVNGVPDEAIESKMSFCQVEGQSGNFYTQGITGRHGYALSGQYTSYCNSEDEEADVFYYKCGSYSGKFVLEEINGEVQVVFLEQQDLYATFEYSSLSLGEYSGLCLDPTSTYINSDRGLIIGFTIHTPEGLKYHFNQIEYSEKIIQNEGAYPFGSAFVSGWYLESVEDLYDNKIEYNYSNYQSHSAQSYHYEKKKEISGTPGEFESAHCALVIKMGEDWRQFDAQQQDLYTNVTYKIYGLRLISLQSNLEKISFIADAYRQDLATNTNCGLPRPRSLDKIEVYYKGENGWSKQKTMDLIQTYSGAAGFPAYKYNRLFLNQIKEYCGVSTNENGLGYRFAYDQTSLPAKDSKERDFWGYYNGNGASSFYPTQYIYPGDSVNNLTYSSIYSIFPRSNHQGQEIVWAGADRNANNSYCQAGILREIQYPNGGKRLFQYELNEIPYCGDVFYGDGLRIKSILTSDGDQNSSDDIETKFFYHPFQIDENEFHLDYAKTSAKLMYLPSFAYFGYDAICPGEYLHDCLERFTIMYSDIINGLQSETGRSVLYEQVVVKHQDNGYEAYKYNVSTTLSTNEALCQNGTCFYKKSQNNLIEQGYFYDNYPAAPNPNLSFIAGLELEYHIIKENAILSKSILNSYDFRAKVVGESSAKNSRSTRFFREMVTPSGMVDFAFDSHFSSFIAGTRTNVNICADYIRNQRYTNYYFLSGTALLVEKEERIFTDQDVKPLVKKTNYSYSENHTQLISSETQVSDGSYLGNYTVWLKDLEFPSQDLLEVHASVLQRMFRSHLNYPIEKIQYRKSNQNASAKITSAELITYTSQTGNLVPYQMYKANLAYPATFNFSKLARIEDGEFKFSVNYDIIEIYDQYNLSGQLIEKHRNYDYSISYLKDVQNRNIGEVQNAKISQVWFEGFDSRMPTSSYDNTEVAYGGKAGRRLIVSASKTLSGLQITQQTADQIYMVSGWFQGDKLELNVSIKKEGNSQETYITEVFNAQGDWTYFSKEFNPKNYVSNGDVELGFMFSKVGNANLSIDELRFCPKTAFMLTQTIDVRTGNIIAKSNINEVFTYYDFDYCGRMREVKNHEGEIQKSLYFYPTNQEAKRSYIEERIPIVSITNEQDYDYVSEDDYHVNLTYFDGLGRVDEIVKRDQSPLERDIVTFYEYDRLGRTIKNYLPFTRDNYVEDELSGSRKVLQNIFWGDLNARAYNKMVYNQTIEKDIKEFWYPREWSDGSRAEKTITYLNQVNEVRNFSSFSWYPKGSLIVSETFDADGNSSKSYQDNTGKVIMEDKEGAKTYYIYDAFQRLRHVIPPNAFHQMDNTGNYSVYNWSTGQYKEDVYHYFYDGRGNMISKHIPSSGWHRFYYNLLNYQILKVDPAKNKTFVKYDKMGRPVITGIYLGTSLPSDTEFGFEIEATSADGYTLENSFPKENIEILSSIFYDHYDYNRDGSLSSSELPTDSNIFKRVKGKEVGMHAKIISADESEMGFTKEKSYYDNKGNEIFLTRLTEGLFYNETEKIFDARNLLQREKRKHTNLSSSLTTIYNQRFEYDRAGREVKSYCNINNEGEYLLRKQRFNEKGQLFLKELGGEGINALQKVQFHYNNRGWLRSLESYNASYQRLFEMNLYYNFCSLPGADSFWNGNISGQRWKIAGQSTRGYTYHYDQRNQLIGANHLVEGKAYSMQPVNEFSVPGVVYDLNGNVIFLTRMDNMGNLMDDLEFDYNSKDQLLAVTEVSSLEKGFKSETGMEAYAYDQNGNLTFDGHKNLEITYNYLNLPCIFSSPFGTLKIDYDAAGNKIRRTLITSTTTEVRYHDDGIHYLNNQIESIRSDEGRWVPKFGGGFRAEYSIKDHLNNVRLRFSDLNDDGQIDYNSEILENHHYYPFGLKLQLDDLVISNSPYQFGNKEMHEEMSIEWLDFGTRWYDPAMGRWNSVDPKAEDFFDLTAYNYAFNNPIKWIDPDGKAPHPGLWGVGPFVFSEQNNGTIYVHQATTGFRKTVNVLEQTARFGLKRMGPIGRGVNLILFNKGNGTYHDPLSDYSVKANPGVVMQSNFGKSFAGKFKELIYQGFNQLDRVQDELYKNDPQKRPFSFKEVGKGLRLVDQIINFGDNISKELSSPPSHNEVLQSITMTLLSYTVEGIDLMHGNGGQTMVIEAGSMMAEDATILVGVAYKELYALTQYYNLGDSEDLEAFIQVVLADKELMNQIVQEIEREFYETRDGEGAGNE